MLVLKKKQEKLLKGNSQVKTFLFPGTAFNDKWNGTYFLSVSFCIREFNKIISKNWKIQKFSFIFFKKQQKMLFKENSQVGRFYFPDTAFNDKSNRTNLLSVSFLCMEKLANLMNLGCNEHGVNWKWVEMNVGWNCFGVKWTHPIYYIICKTYIVFEYKIYNICFQIYSNIFKYFQIYML